jgi:hypothetical protein
MESDDSPQCRVESVDKREIVGIAEKLMKLYADRSGGRWIVLDSEGDFWELPAVENPWENRQPFQPTDETELEPVPGHYKHLLGLPL